MDKYGFEYFTKRVEVLSEMAGRPSALLSLGEAGAKMSNYISKIGSIIRTGGSFMDSNIETGEPEENTIPGFPGNTQSRVYKYIVNTILDLEGINPKFETDSVRTTASGLSKRGGGVDSTSNGALKILGIHDKTPTATGMKPVELFAKAIYKWTSENGDKVISKEFEDKVTSPQEILFYLKHNRSSETGTGRLKDKEIQDIHGVSVEELHNIVSKAAPLVARINKAHGYKYGASDPTKAFSRPGLADSNAPEEQPSSKDIWANLDLNNNNTDNLYILSGALKEYGKYIQYFKHLFSVEEKKEAYKKYTNPIQRKYAIIKTLSERLNEREGGDVRDPEETVEQMISADLSVFKQLLNILKQAQESGTGIALKAFFRVLNIIKSKDPENDDLQNTVELIYAYLGTITALDQQKHKARKEGEYRGFDPDIVNSIATTPEDKAIFDRWYDVVYYPAEKAKEEKLLDQASGEMTTNRAEERRKFDTFQKHEVNTKGQLVNRQGMYDTSEEKDKQLKAELMASLEDRPVEDWTNSEYLEAKRLGILKDLQSGKTEEITSDMEDEGIAHLKSINKAAEQKRLRELKAESYVMNYMTEQISKDRFKPIGEFKDRGFKKMNYDQWLRKNS